MIQLWFVSRALGLVALLLLSLVIALGALHNTTLVHETGERIPRFVLVALHRNLSLVTVVLVVLHVVTVLVTPYLRLRWFDVLVPGTVRYNVPSATLGVVAFDLLLAIVVTGVLRARLSRRVWFLVHWSAYVCFPVAVAHAVANASFRGTTWWTLVVPVLSVGVVVAALVHRRRSRRRPALPLADRGRPDTSERPENPKREPRAPRPSASPEPRGALDAPTERVKRAAPARPPGSGPAAWPAGAPSPPPGRR